jgi:ABC-type amino acid transport substrate-binding protein
MTRTRWLVIALVSIFALALAAGCGDDDDGGDTTSGGDTAGLELLEEGTLTVGTDTPYPPFEFGDPPDYEGFDIDVINAIAEDQGLSVAMVDAPFDVILAGQEGRFDLSIAATTITPARENRVDFSDPYFESEQSLLVRTDSDIASIDDITADTVVGAEDATTGETYANDNTDAEVRSFPNIDDAYNALVAGQVDAVINDLPASAQAVEDKEGLEIVETFPTDEQYGIVFPEDSPLVDPINESLQKLKDDGTLAEIFSQWFSGEELPESLLTATHDPT